ncbi:MAG: TetR/AcrR family transcriptional regulator [Ruminiclostridium sp.]|nr:TetR/AcrR family transcriptional regulator [Ruminiclostridium sp.]
MPPKARITREMVIEAGLNIVRKEGAEALNVRRVASELDCSTQPVMYHYKTVGELKADVYAAADGFHTNYLMNPDESTADPRLSIGMRYIRFANEEKHLFRFLFQSGKFRNADLRDLIYSDELAPLIQAICGQTGLSGEQAREAFETLFVCVHGAASILANNEMEFDEAYYVRMLGNTFNGMVSVLKGEEKK